MYIGIDLSKDVFHASGLYTPQKTSFQGVEFLNSEKGFIDFLNFLFDMNLSSDSLLVCMESTGVYGERLCHYLHKVGFSVFSEPPQYVRRAFRLKRKTDRVDSQMIAEYAFRFCDQLHRWKPQDKLIEQVRTLLNNREIFQKGQTAHKNILRALGQKEIQDLDNYHEETISFFSDRMKEIDDKLKALIKDADQDVRTGFEMLLSIPGVGWQWAAYFFIVTKGFHYLNYRKLAAYLGLVPYEHQSGSSVYKNPKTDRSGPNAFRKLLYLSAISVCRGQFKSYFQQKKVEGKNGKLILNNIENKLLKIACACVRDKKSFHPGHRSVNPLN